MRRRALLGAVVLICIGLALAFMLWPSPPQHQITFEAFGKIKNGMTLNEVEEIVGVPPGIYYQNQRRPARFEPKRKRAEWQADRVVIWVDLQDGKVIDACAVGLEEKVSP
jgi:hypothetical protein